MPTLKFSGSSDDTFGEYNHFKDDADNCASGRPLVFKVMAGDAGFYVWGLYGCKGAPGSTPACWVIGTQKLDEDQAFPDWPMRYESPDGDESHILVIEAPDGVTMEYVRD